MNPIFQIRSYEEFEHHALEIFRKQYKYTEVYHEFVNYLCISPKKVRSIREIPFLPVELFKNHKIIDRRKKEKIVFSSSGTTGSVRSRHYVADPELYEYSFSKAFQQFYGSPARYSILALLPSYLEREGSSLVYMMDRLIGKSQHHDSGFYLHDHEKLIKKLKKLKAEGQKTLLLGVSFAFIELTKKYSEDLSGVIFMETGGMKGKEKEITRNELHEILKKSFHTGKIHSEYGMTELLSQAYSYGEGRFFSPPWMKVLIRDSHDPFNLLSPGKTGSINIIDLANLHSCSFLATSDIGRVNKDNSFEVLGRMDASDVRGCNLLIG